jgi:hypothetical protein
LPQLSDQLIKVEENEKEGIKNTLSLNENKLIYVLWAALKEETLKRKQLEQKINDILKHIKGE